MIRTLSIRKGYSDAINTSQITAHRLLQRAYVATSTSRADRSSTLRSGLPSGLVRQVHIEPKFNLGLRFDRTQLVDCLLVDQYDIVHSTGSTDSLTIVFSICPCNIRVEHYRLFGWILPYAKHLGLAVVRRCP